MKAGINCGLTGRSGSLPSEGRTVGIGTLRTRLRPEWLRTAAVDLAEGVHTPGQENLRIRPSRICGLDFQLARPNGSSAAATFGPSAARPIRRAAHTSRMIGRIGRSEKREVDSIHWGRACALRGGGIKRQFALIFSVAEVETSTPTTRVGCRQCVAAASAAGVISRAVRTLRVSNVRCTALYVARWSPGGGRPRRFRGCVIVKNRVGHPRLPALRRVASRGSVCGNGCRVWRTLCVGAIRPCVG